MHDFNRNSSVVLVPLREVLTGTVETSLLILYLAVGVLLAIACFNTANLLSLGQPHGGRKSRFARRSARAVARSSASFS